MPISSVLYLNKKNDLWGKSKFQYPALSKEVAQFHFVAHENIDNEGDGDGIKPTNHWSLFLTINGSSSVRVEVAPDDLGKPGMVLIESKKYDVTTKITKKVSINAPRGLTVAGIFNLIIQKKRDCYIFAPVGEGCRFWLYTLAGDFVGAKLISKADAENVSSILTKYWPYPTGTPPVDRPMAIGQFPNSGH
ncbi:hypothetical protein BDN67DRAFT_992850 [Paxillus ammoniavirescens]|nr:hypothetical protein BDN67DRAFT_992850 [Paxillus ammoniavirescens]